VTSRRERALALLAGGASQADAARAVGVSRQAVSAWAAEAGIPARPREGGQPLLIRLSDADRAALEDLAVRASDVQGRRVSLAEVVRQIIRDAAVHHRA
jgi:transposase